MRQTNREYVRERTAIDSNGCWIWQKTVYPNGYGHSSPARPGGAYAHRLSFIAFTGLSIPRGAHLDHLCRVHACANPDHLEVVTPRENIMRSPIALASLNARKTHCKRGHEFTDANTYRYRGGRACRTCIRISDRRRVQSYAQSPEIRDRTHCMHGHDLSVSEYWDAHGRRLCKTCKSISARAYRDKIRSGSSGVQS